MEPPNTSFYNHRAICCGLAWVGSTMLTLALPAAIVNFVLPLPYQYIGIGLLVFLMLWLAYIYAQYFANYFLYQKDDPAELQVLGSAIDGARLRAFLNGKLFGRSGGYFFAKLSASRQVIRVQTSLGNYRWDGDDVRAIVRNLGAGNWNIGEEDAEGGGYVIFKVLPGKGAMVERKMTELGYDVRPRSSSGR